MQSIQADTKIGREGMIVQGTERGYIGKPTRSHEELDTVEIVAEQTYKGLYEDTMRVYDDYIQSETEGVPSQLFVNDSEKEFKVQGGNSSSSMANNRFSEILEKSRTSLSVHGLSAVKSTENLKQFRAIHHLERVAEFPENREKRITIILSILLSISSVFIIGLISSTSPDGSNQFDILGTGLMIIGINTVLGIIAAESWRARKHQLASFRIGAIFLLVIISFISLTVNLGSGHYRDALNPEFPPNQSIDSNNDEPSLVEQVDNCSRSSSSSETLCLLTKHPFTFNEFHSIFVVLIGIMLMTITAWYWWKNDDEYFLYGTKTRKHARHLSEWHQVREHVVRSLQTQYDQSVQTIRGARIDFREHRKKIIRNCGNHLDSATTLMKEIEETCENSIRSYRTANIEVRPRLVGYPPHWDEKWMPSWGKLMPASLSDLCSQEQAIKLMREQDEMIDREILAVETLYQEYLEKITGFGPRNEEV